MFRVTKNGAFDLQAVLLMCWINYVEHGESGIGRKSKRRSALMSRKNKPPVHLSRDSAAISQASHHEQAHAQIRWLELADIALHNHSDSDRYEDPATALENKRNIIRMTNALIKQFSRERTA